MGKRKVSADQIAFAFDAPEPARVPAALAGLEAQIARSVGTILHDDERSREVIAAEMSVLLDEEVSKAMLDAYASAAREGHKVPFSRYLALIAVCDRHDVLDQVVRPIGAAVLVGEEVHTARVGHVRQQMKHLQAELRRLEQTAPMIRGSKHT